MFTFNMVAMPKKNVWDRTFWMDGCEAYEFHGRFYHGCPKCFPADTVNPVSCLTMHELYERTQVKTTWQVVEMWECEFHHFLQRNTTENVRGQFEGYCRSFEPARRIFRGSGQCHQIAGKDRINHNKNQVRGFYQSLPVHQQERCIPCGSSHHFHGEHTP